MQLSVTPVKSRVCRALLTIPITLLTWSAEVSAAGEQRTTSSERESMIRLQVFLDSQGFRPGIIDGKWGEFTAKALTAHNRAHGVENSHSVDHPPTELPCKETDPTTTTCTLTEDDFANIGPAPEALEEKAALKRLPYATIAELVSERFHCHPDLLRELNPGVSFNRLKPGDTLRVPAVAEPFYLPKSELFRGAEPIGKNLPENLMAKTLQIDTRRSVLEVLGEKEGVIAFYPITPGSERLPVPAGTWSVKSISVMPVFRHDERMLNEGERSDDALLLPPGPNSPVGIVWIALNKDGIGLHGTDAPETIGRSSSHGCVRLANWDAADLRRRIKPGTKVKIDVSSE